MPVEVSPPKYVVIINALQGRIEDGTYPAGALLPSEATLTREFAAARPTVVRALEYLRQQGWIESRQGRGRFVLGKPTVAGARLSGYGYVLLNTGEDSSVTVLAAGLASASRRIAAMLGVAVGSTVVIRRRLVTIAGAGPAELHTVYAPADIASGTALGAREPLPDGLLTHLRRRTGVDLDHASERISARPASVSEARVMKVTARDCVLTVLLILHTRAGRPLAAIEVVLPASRRSLEQVLPLR